MVLPSEGVTNDTLGKITEKKPRWRIKSKMADAKKLVYHVHEKLKLDCKIQNDGKLNTCMLQSSHIAKCLLHSLKITGRIVLKLQI